MNTINEKKNTTESINSRLYKVEERICEVEEGHVKFAVRGEQRKKN